MSDKAHGASERRINSYSIVRKLSRRLTARLLWIFISIDILIAILAGAGMASYCEARVLSVTRQAEMSGPPSGEAAAWAALSGVTITEAEPGGGAFTVAYPLSGLLPSGTAAFERELRVAGRYAAYIVYIPYGDATYAVSVDIWRFVAIFRTALIVLGIWEFLTLLISAARRRRLIRRTLGPIAELARTAESINRAAGMLDRDGINRAA